MFHKLNNALSIRCSTSNQRDTHETEGKQASAFNLTASGKYVSISVSISSNYPGVQAEDSSVFALGAALLNTERKAAAITLPHPLPCFTYDCDLLKKHGHLSNFLQRRSSLWANYF